MNLDKIKELQKRIIDSYLNEIANRALTNLGNSPIVYLDTSSILDFERFLSSSCFSHDGACREYFYQELGKRLPMIYVTSRVFGEITLHSEKYFINGRNEISREALVFANLAHQKNCDFIREREHRRDFEQIRYDAHWASLIAFNSDHKKACLDIISPTDLDLVASAADSRYFKGISGVVVLSSDTHVEKTISVLQNPETYRSNYETIVENFVNRLSTPSERERTIKSLLNNSSYGLNYRYENIKSINTKGKK